MTPHFGVSLPTPSASGIPVFCAHTRIVPLGELRPNPVNPNRHPAKQIEIYSAVIKAHGWRRPITVSNRSGLIVRGHGAHLAAQSLGLAEVPVEFQDYQSEAAELEDLLADNRVADFSKTDSDALAQLLQKLALEAPGAVTGYSADDLAALIEEVAPTPQYPITAKLNERHDYVVIVVDSETDWVFLKNMVGVRTERSHKNTTVGEGRVVPFARFLSSIRENLHSLAQARGVHDDAPLAP